jgi:uncharacterized protein YggU (UPF0235/DUF167 family)
MIITAKIKTSQKKFEISKKGNIWIISVTSPPQRNEANREIIKELSKLYGPARIISGLKSSRKKIEIGSNLSINPNHHSDYHAKRK